MSEWFPAGFLLTLHLIWALWMIGGVALAVAGFWWAHLLRWRLFRSAHLIGIVVTATVPLWGEGICPLPRWESDLTGDSALPGPFMLRLVRAVLYLDVSPTILSIIAGVGALATIVIFVMHPPWEETNRRQ